MSNTFSSLDIDPCTYFCGNDKTCSLACNAFYNCAVTNNMLFNLILVILNDLPIVTTGIGSIIEQKGGLLAARLGLYQQIPLLIIIFFVSIFLVYSGAIKPSTGIVIVIISIIIIGFFLGVSYYDAKYTLESLGQTIEQTFRNNVKVAGEQIAADYIPIYIAAAEKTKVPCSA